MTLIESEALALGGSALLGVKANRIEKAVSAVISSSVVSAVARKYNIGRARIASTTSVTAHGGKFKTASGTSSSLAVLEVHRTARDIMLDMNDYLPTFYHDFDEVMRINRTEANEFTRVQDKLLELLDQFYVATASLALDRWKSLTKVTSDDDIRQKIMAKLRGVGIVNAQLLGEIVDSFYECETTELARDNAVRFKIVGKRGVPDNITEVQTAINDVIPAHIVPQYEFTYLPWNELESSGMRWSDAGNYTWEELEESFLTEGEFN